MPLLYGALKPYSALAAFFWGDCPVGSKAIGLVKQTSLIELIKDRLLPPWAVDMQIPRRLSPETIGHSRPHH